MAEGKTYEPLQFPDGIGEIDGARDVRDSAGVFPAREDDLDRVAGGGHHDACGEVVLESHTEPGIFIVGPQRDVQDETCPRREDIAWRDAEFDLEAGLVDAEIAPASNVRTVKTERDQKGAVVGVIDLGR